MPLDGLREGIRGAVQRLAREGMVEVATTTTWVHPGPIPAHKLRWMNPATPEAKAWMGDWNAIWDRIDRIGDCPFVLRLTLEGAEAANPPQTEPPERVSAADLCKHGQVSETTLRTIADKAILPIRQGKGAVYRLDEVHAMLCVDRIQGKVSERKLSTFRAGIKLWLRL
ncbi:MAG: hypothetical protein ACK51N_02105 [bacterium]